MTLEQPEGLERWEPYRWPQVEMSWQSDDGGYWLARWKGAVDGLMADGPTREEAFAALLPLVNDYIGLLLNDEAGAWRPIESAPPASNVLIWTTEGQTIGRRKERRSGSERRIEDKGSSGFRKGLRRMAGKDRRAARGQSASEGEVNLEGAPT